jgi:hypothetical protein
MILISEIKTFAGVIAIGIALGIGALRLYYHPMHFWFVWPAIRGRLYPWHPVALDDLCFLGKTARVKAMVGEIAAQQRQLDTMGRPAFREPVAANLKERIDIFRNNISGFAQPLASEFRRTAERWLAIAERQYDKARLQMLRRAKASSFPCRRTGGERYRSLRTANADHRTVGRPGHVGDGVSRPFDWRPAADGQVDAYPESDWVHPGNRQGLANLDAAGTRLYLACAPMRPDRGRSR